MQIAKNSVVSITYKLSDATGHVLEQSTQPVSYLHGGYDGIFPAVEEALQGKSAGETVSVRLEPEDAFGEYDAELMRVESRSLFPATDITVGMQFQGDAEDSSEAMIFTVTEVTEEKVVVDGNHPLAGHSLDFECTVMEVRPATEEEIAHGHIHGPHGHQH